MRRLAALLEPEPGHHADGSYSVLLPQPDADMARLQRALLTTPGDWDMNFPFENEPGWLAAFTRKQVAGAILNGTRIVKAASEPKDAHPDGALGTVLGSFSHVEVQGGALLYFVEWDSEPGVPVAILGYKIEPAEDAS